MGHSASNTAEEQKPRWCQKQTFALREKTQQQPYGEEKTECHNPVLIFRVASESSV